MPRPYRESETPARTAAGARGTIRRLGSRVHEIRTYIWLRHRRSARRSLGKSGELKKSEIPADKVLEGTRQWRQFETADPAKRWWRLRCWCPGWFFRLWPRLILVSSRM